MWIGLVYSLFVHFHSGFQAMALKPDCCVQVFKWRSRLAFRVQIVAWKLNIYRPDLFWPFKNQTSLLFRSWLCINDLQCNHCNNFFLILQSVSSSFTTIQATPLIFFIFVKKNSSLNHIKELDTCKSSFIAFLPLLIILQSCKLIRMLFFTSIRLDPNL